MLTTIIKIIRRVIMKKYLVAGGLASVLLLGACGDEEEPEMSDDAVDTEQEAEEDGTAIDADNGEEESEDDESDRQDTLDDESDVDDEDEDSE